MPLIVENLRESTIRQLQTANEALRLGNHLKASFIYKKVLKKDILALFHEPQHPYGWSISRDDSISFNHALVLLSDYFLQIQDATHWDRAKNTLIGHPDYNNLHINDRIHIDITSIQRIVSHNVLDLQNTLKRLFNYLTLDNIDDLLKGLIHFTISRLAVVIRDEELAFTHQNKATHFLSANEEPYFNLLMLEQLATIHYMLNNNRRSYYEKAIQIYHKAEHRARLLDNGHDFTYNGYNLGWVYAELELYEDAESHFQRAIVEAESTQNAPKVAQCEYGLGYVYSCLENYDKSTEYLTNALMYFCDKSYNYTAACLNLLASTLLSQGHIDRAIKRLDFAVANLAKIDRPVQLHHVYRQYSKAYYMNKNWIKALQYVFKTYELRLKYKMPLFPY